MTDNKLKNMEKYRLTDEEILATPSLDTPRNADGSYDVRLMRMNRERAVAQAQFSKLLPLLEEAKREERERVLKVLDDYYDLFADEFCAKYHIKEKNPDMWDAKSIIRQALQRGKDGE